jgi:hypothetical protein
MTDHDPITNAFSPPACLPTLDRMQRVLDGELPSAVLDCDAHARACATCRERIAAARLLQSARTPPVSVPSGLGERILLSARQEHLSQVRRRSFLAVGGGIVAAIAASVLVAAWLAGRPQVDPPHEDTGPGPELARHLPEAAPEPRPVRLGTEFSRMGQALLDSSKPITEPVSTAPRVLAALGETLAPPVPMTQFEPAASALAELPDAARVGLEPVTSTTQKAFARLLRDIGGVQVSSRPKS